jgi:hypothetical protein
MKRSDLEKSLSKTKSKIDFHQDEYFTLLFDLINHTEGLISKNKPYSYWWEKLKELQLSINTYSNISRETSMDIAKSALEEAFTPKIKRMLSEKVRKDIENDK